MASLFNTLDKPDWLLAALLSDQTLWLTRWEQGTLAADIPIGTSSTNLLTGTFTLPIQGLSYNILAIATVLIVASAAVTVRTFLNVAVSGGGNGTRETDTTLTGTISSITSTSFIMNGGAPPGASFTYALTATASVASTATAKQNGAGGSAATEICIIWFPAPIPT